MRTAEALRDGGAAALKFSARHMLDTKADWFTYAVMLVPALVAMVAGAALWGTANLLDGRKTNRPQLE
jgi:hypothetical protein